MIVYDITPENYDHYLSLNLEESFMDYLIRMRREQKIEQILNE